MVIQQNRNLLPSVGAGGILSMNTLHRRVRFHGFRCVLRMMNGEKLDSLTRPNKQTELNQNRNMSKPNSSPIPITAAYITESGGTLLGTDTGRQNIIRFTGPFRKVVCESNDTVRNSSGQVIKILDFEGSSFLLSRTNDWFRRLKPVPSPVPSPLS